MTWMWISTERQRSRSGTGVRTCLSTDVPRLRLRRQQRRRHQQSHHLSCQRLTIATCCPLDNTLQPLSLHAHRVLFTKRCLKLTFFFFASSHCYDVQAIKLNYFYFRVSFFTIDLCKTPAKAYFNEFSPLRQGHSLSLIPPPLFLLEIGLPEPSPRRSKGVL